MLRPAARALRSLQLTRLRTARARCSYATTANEAEIRAESSPHPAPSLPKRPSTKYTTPTHLLTQKHSAETQKIIKLAQEYVLPVYARPDFVLERGEGSWVYDTDGRKWLDFTAGIAVNSLGHADKGVAEVLATQAGKLLHASNVYHNEWAARLAELLVTLTRREGGLGFAAGSSAPPGLSASRADDVPAGGAKVFFANSGTEANEGALKIARKVGKDRGGASKTRIACFQNAFHGRSMGALSVTPNPKYQAPFAPLIPGVDVGVLGDVEGLEGLVGEETCAVIVEPVQGEGGVNAASAEWLGQLRKRCDEVGAVLIFDEIQCGLYRTGQLWAHSALPVDCHPDIVTMAKPLANGYPIGAVLLRDSVANTMTAGTHGTTFGGSPLACAVGYHVLSRLSARPFVAHIAETAAYLRARLALLPEWFPGALQRDVRGRGLLLGLGFHDKAHAGEVVQLARERGVLFLTAGADAVRIVPSLNVGRKEVDDAVDVLESCMEVLGSGEE